jgi:hypothetical protein
MVQMDITVKLPPKNQMPLGQLAKAETLVEGALKGNVKNRLRKAMLKRVANWETRPNFRSRFSKPANTFGQIIVFPSGPGRDKWLWVSRGTKRVTRYPVRSRFLIFRTGYSPKTGVGNVYGGPGRRHGPLIRRTAATSGIPARNFEEHILDEEAESIVNDLSVALQGVI